MTPPTVAVSVGFRGGANALGSSVRRGVHGISRIPAEAPIRGVAAFVRGLVSIVVGKNGWQLAE
jgi:hypothetical protein